jgi:hypothetical protein
MRNADVYEKLAWGNTNRLPLVLENNILVEHENFNLLEKTLHVLNMSEYLYVYGLEIA